MKLTLVSPICLCLALIGFAAGCSGRGPDVVDPNSSLRTQAAVLSIAGGTVDELAIYSEGAGLKTEHAWLDANGAALDRPVDGVFQAFDRLYLLHRATGTISIAELSNRRKVIELGGFPASADSGLVSIAFSNLSQGWAIALSRPVVYHIDLVNTVVVAELPMPGLPTAVATAGNRVFVATLGPDGTGVVSVFRSNQQGFPIEQTLSFPTPVIFLGQNGAQDAVVAVTAGSAARKPAVHSIKLATVEKTGDKELTSAPLTARIGRVPEFATITRDNYLYLAVDDDIVRVDVRASRLPVSNWLPGTYDVLSADYWTDLLYAVEPNSTEVVRVSADGSEIAPLRLSAPVRAIEFVNATKLE